MNPTLESELGIYTVTLTFTPDGVAANALTARFMVHVYPATDYESVNATSQCESNIWPMMFYGINDNTIVNAFDIDSDGG